MPQSYPPQGIMSKHLQFYLQKVRASYQFSGPQIALGYTKLCDECLLRDALRRAERPSRAGPELFVEAGRKVVWRQMVCATSA